MCGRKHTLVFVFCLVGNTIQHLGEELPMKELLTGLQAGLRSLYVMLWPQRPAATGEHHTRLTLRALTPLEKCCLHPTFALSSFSSSLLRVSIWISFHEVKILIPHCILSFFSVNSQIWIMQLKRKLISSCAFLETQNKSLFYLKCLVPTNQNQLGFQTVVTAMDARSP